MGVSLSIPAAAVWWLRSPNYNNINNNNYFCAVSSSGSLDYNNANNAYGVVPGFCNAWSHGDHSKRRGTSLRVKPLKLLFDMLTRTLLAWRGMHLTAFHVPA